MYLPVYYKKQQVGENNSPYLENIKQKGIQLVIAFLIFFLLISFNDKMLTPFVSSMKSNILSPIQKKVEPSNEVFGFAPYWTFDKLDNVDFDVLTTFAYFGIEANGDGNLDKSGRGYQVFQSDKATEVFKKAHAHGSRVVLTITQMNNEKIKSLMDSSDNQNRLIDQTVSLVKDRGIDGVNVDFEYVGDPGEQRRSEFTSFVSNLTQKMHKEVPSSKVTVSVYATAAKYPKLHNVGEVAKATDGIFMMAYDFATSGSDVVIPTAPLNGYKEGKYWYDISTAVDDFLSVMPAKKLILGLPWYGYNYPVENPQVKAAKDNGYYTYYWWKGYRYSRYVGRENASAQTYASALDNNPQEESGWDDVGKVGWRAYKDSSGMWRMIFLEDAKSLKIKYDFAKNKDLGGVGIWALGFDQGKGELWALLKDQFGTDKIADTNITNRRIN